MSGVITFDGQPPPGTINFGVGQPSPDLLPVDLIKEASAAFFAEAEPLEFNYGVTEGDGRFLELLAEFLTRHYETPTPVDQLFVTGGNSQALDMASAIFARQGDTVFVEEPSYFLAFQVFRDHGLNVVGVPVDDDGMSIDAVQELLKQHKPAFIYTIPSFLNPGGQCLSADRRQKLLGLAQTHDFMIVADEVYQLLSYTAEPPPAFGTMAESGHVLSLGSFSKILAPGLRLGWIQTSPEIRQRLVEVGFVNSGGSINHISSHIVRKAIELGLQDKHLDHVRSVYGSRAAVMHESLEAEFGDMARWVRPDGGYFFWLEFDEAVDTTPLREEALKRECGFQPGPVFSPTGQLKNFLRLSFAHYSEDDIREGISRVRTVFD